MSEHDEIIVDAENTLMKAKAALMEFAAPEFPRSLVQELVEALDSVLEAHAELNIIYDDDGNDLEPDEFYLEVDHEPDDEPYYPSEDDGV